MGENKKKKSIFPAVIFQIGKWVSVKDKTVSISEGKEPIMMCKDLSGKYLFIKFAYYKQEGELLVGEVKDFFEKKKEQMVSGKEILKVKDYLENSEEVDNIIESKGLSRKEEKEWLKDEAQRIVEDNWNINTGKWMRGALSMAGETVTFNAQQYPLYESKTIIWEKEGEPSKSGLYYITKNRHNIPVKVNNLLKGGRVVLNSGVANADNFESLVRHAIRTADKGVGFLPEFASNDGDYKSACLAINKYKRNEEYGRFIDGCNFLLGKKDPLIAVKVKVELPMVLNKSFEHELLVEESNSMLNNLKNGVERIYHWDDSDEETLKAGEEVLEVFKDTETIYGFYDIVSIGDEIDGNTYGFMQNNVVPRKTYFDLDTIKTKMESLG